MPVWIRPIACLRCEFHVSFFFFFHHVWTIATLFMHMDSLCRRQSALFTRPTTILLRKKILKMGPTALFIHLKIILLKCFQFSIFSKISCIRTDPTYFENLTVGFYCIFILLLICTDQILFKLNIIYYSIKKYIFYL